LKRLFVYISLFERPRTRIVRNILVRGLSLQHLFAYISLFERPRTRIVRTILVRGVSNKEMCTKRRFNILFVCEEVSQYETEVSRPGSLSELRGDVPKCTQFIEWRDCSQSRRLSRSETRPFHLERVSLN